MMVQLSRGPTWSFLDTFPSWRLLENTHRVLWNKQEHYFRHWFCLLLENPSKQSPQTFEKLEWSLVYTPPSLLVSNPRPYTETPKTVIWVACVGGTWCVHRITTGAIHSTKISGNFGQKLNGSVRSIRKSFEKTGPPFEVDHFSRSDRSEFWLNG